MASKTGDNKVKIYCGDKPSLPTTGGYNRFGTRAECLRCGFGAAMYQYKWAPAAPGPKPASRTEKGCVRVRDHPSGIVRGDQFVGGSGFSAKRKPKRDVILSVWVALLIVLGLCLHEWAPSSLFERDPMTRTKTLNWKKFVLVYIGLSVGLTALFLLSIWSIGERIPFT